jgi:hypothetical protein
VSDTINIANLTLDASGIATAVQQAKASLGQLTDEVKHSGEAAHHAAEEHGGMMHSVMEYMELSKAIELFHEVTAAIMDFEAASVKFEATFNAMGATVGLTHNHLTELADELSHTTLFDEKQYLTAEARLLVFGKVQGEVFERTIKLSADLATITGQDLASSARQLGMALENPQKGFQRLARQVGDLSAAQKQSIKDFMAHDDIVGAQTVLLDALEKKMGGAADMMNNTLSGAFASVHKSWDHFLEGAKDTSPITDYLIPALKYWADLLDRIEAHHGPATAKNLKSELKDAQAEKDAMSNGARDKDGNEVSDTGATAGLKFINAKIAGLKALIAAQEEAEKSAKAVAEGAAARAREQTKIDDANAKAEAAAEALHKKNTATIAEATLKLREYQTAWKESGDSVEVAKLRLAGATPELIRAQQAMEGFKADDAAIRAQEAAAQALYQRNQEALVQSGEKAAASTRERETVESLTKATTAQIVVQQQIAKEREEDAKATEHMNATQKAQYDADTAVDRFNRGVITNIEKIAKENETASKAAEKDWENAWKKVGDDFQSLVVDVMTGKVHSLRDVFKQLFAELGAYFARLAVMEAATSGGNWFKGLHLGGGSDALKGAVDTIAPSFGGDVFDAHVGHTGGLLHAGEGSMRSVSSSIFRGAGRFHNGLKPDEFPAILQKGEGVFTRKQMQALGAGMGGGSGDESHVHLHVHAADGPSVEALFRSQSGMIAGIVAEAAQRSRTFSRALSGGGR